MDTCQKQLAGISHNMSYMHRVCLLQKWSLTDLEQLFIKFRTLRLFFYKDFEETACSQSSVMFIDIFLGISLKIITRQKKSQPHFLLNLSRA